MTVNTQPALSLLVPIYNVEKYLAQCLESARHQTMQNIEIICINDGSSDGSLEIIRNFMDEDPRFVLVDKANSGYGASMNKGLEAASGKYIGILESDDFLDSRALELLYYAAEEHEVEVVKSNFFLYWSTPHERDELFELVTPAMANRLVNPQEEREIFYLKPSIWSAIYRRSFLEDNDIVFLETPGASYQDAGFNFKVWTSATRVIFLSEAYLHYRQDNETSSVNAPGKVYCVCDEYREMEHYLSCRPEKKELLSSVLVKMRYDSYLWNYDRLAPEFKLEFLRHMSKEFSADHAKGTIDYDLFEPWKIADLETILASPEQYHAQRSIDEGEGCMSKIRHYYGIGGFPLLTRIIREKLIRG
ncbi:MAG: glycosyltransferase family 2 protein [Gordonibacter sp.]|uniref:glycosyltransferase family 2 protein n=1 Tax=Gordonibacter sp. TaxID=1968902 RepID=UPI002FCBBE57